MKHELLVDQVQLLAESGKTKRDISAELNIPITTLCRLCNKFNIKTDGHLLYRICGFNSEQQLLDHVKNLYDAEMTIDEIAVDIGTTYPSLFQHLTKSGFKFRTISEWRMVNVPRIDLTALELEIITGMLLGDGYITVPKRTGYLGYTCHYKSVLDNILEQYLPRLFMRIHKHEQFDERTNKTYTNYVARSRCFQIFTDLRKLWYPNGIKIIPQDLVLTPEICYWWYLGDGGSCNNSLILCTNGFTNDDVERLSALIPVRNSIYQQYLKKTDKFYPVIQFTKIEDRIEFFKYIGSCRHPEYNHRWIIQHKSGDITDFCYSGDYNRSNLESFDLSEF